MGAQGTATVNFGSFPGGALATVDVTGQAGILNTSLIEAWIQPAATADHLVGEHIVDPPMVRAATIVVGTGFTIYATPSQGMVNAHYGQWNVAWVWN